MDVSSSLPASINGVNKCGKYKKYILRIETHIRGFKLKIETTIQLYTAEINTSIAWPREAR